MTDAEIAAEKLKKRADMLIANPMERNLFCNLVSAATVLWIIVSSLIQGHYTLDRGRDVAPLVQDLSSTLDKLTSLIRDMTADLSDEEFLQEITSLIQMLGSIGE
ncbi:MAG: hypothetical protein ACFFER_18760 [Candidatus Thorarchaeota archaeon]